MTTYDDPALALDDNGITIKNYFLPGRPRTIPWEDIVQVELIPLGFATGRHQLVGIGPLRPRLFFHWDRARSHKSHGLTLELGRRLRVAITPDEPETVLALIRGVI